MIVARLTLENGDVAELDEEGEWSSSVQYLAAYLNTVYGIGRIPSSPSAPRTGVGNQAVIASEKLPAALQWLVPESKEGVVY